MSTTTTPPKPKPSKRRTRARGVSLPKRLDRDAITRANSLGLSWSGYVRRLVERDVIGWIPDIPSKTEVGV